MIKHLRHLILTFIIWQTSFAIYGQMQFNKADINYKNLIGIWYVSNTYPSTEDSLIFKRVARAPYNFGDRIEIYENGEIVDAYSAKCGNDGRRRYIKGIWTIDTETMILTSTVAIYLQDKRYNVSKLTEDLLILKRL